MDWVLLAVSGVVVFGFVTLWLAFVAWFVLWIEDRYEHRDAKRVEPEEFDES